MAKILLDTFCSVWSDSFTTVSSDKSTSNSILINAGSVALAINSNWMSAVFLAHPLTKDIVNGLFADKDKVVEKHKIHLLNSLASINGVECDSILTSNIAAMLLIIPTAIETTQGQLESINRLLENKDSLDEYGDIILSRKTQTDNIIKELTAVLNLFKNRMESVSKQCHDQATSQEINSKKFDELISKKKEKENVINDLFAAGIINKEEKETKIVAINKEVSLIVNEFQCEHQGLINCCKSVRIPNTLGCHDHICHELGCTNVIPSLKMSFMNNIVNLGELVSNLMKVNDNFCEEHKCIIGFERPVEGIELTKNRRNNCKDIDLNKNSLQEITPLDKSKIPTWAWAVIIMLVIFLVLSALANTSSGA